MAEEREMKHKSQGGQRRMCDVAQSHKGLRGRQMSGKFRECQNIEEHSQVSQGYVDETTQTLSFSEPMDQTVGT